MPTMAVVATRGCLATAFLLPRATLLVTLLQNRLGLSKFSLYDLPLPPIAHSKPSEARKLYCLYTDIVKTILGTDKTARFNLMVANIVITISFLITLTLAFHLLFEGITTGRCWMVKVFMVLASISCILLITTFVIHATLLPGTFLTSYLVYGGMLALLLLTLPMATYCLTVRRSPSPVLAAVLGSEKVTVVEAVDKLWCLLEEQAYWWSSRAAGEQVEPVKHPCRRGSTFPIVLSPDRSGEGVEVVYIGVDLTAVFGEETSSGGIVWALTQHLQV